MSATDSECFEVETHARKTYWCLKCYTLFGSQQAANECPCDDEAAAVLAETQRRMLNMRPK